MSIPVPDDLPTTLTAFLLARSRENAMGRDAFIGVPHASHNADVVGSYRADCPHCRMTMLSWLDPTDPDVVEERDRVLSQLAWKRYRQHPHWSDDWLLEDDEQPRCRVMSQSPWGLTQCVLPMGHPATERHAYSPSEHLEDAP